MLIEEGFFLGASPLIYQHWIPSGIFLWVLWSWFIASANLHSNLSFLPWVVLSRLVSKFVLLLDIKVIYMYVALPKHKQRLLWKPTGKYSGADHSLFLSFSQVCILKSYLSHNRFSNRLLWRTLLNVFKKSRHISSINSPFSACLLKPSKNTSSFIFLSQNCSDYSPIN